MALSLSLFCLGIDSLMCGMLITDFLTLLCVVGGGE